MTVTVDDTGPVIVATTPRPQPSDYPCVKAHGAPGHYMTAEPRRLDAGPITWVCDCGLRFQFGIGAVA